MTCEKCNVFACSARSDCGNLHDTILAENFVFNDRYVGSYQLCAPLRGLDFECNSQFGPIKLKNMREQMGGKEKLFDISPCNLV